MSLPNTDNDDVYLFGLLNKKSVVLSNSLLKLEIEPVTMTQLDDSVRKLEDNVVKFEKGRVEYARKLSDEEILALVAREFGHWKKGHFIIKKIFVQVCNRLGIV